MRTRTVALVGVAALLLAACGSSGGSSGGGQKVSTTSTRPASDEDKRIAEAGVLRRSDLPKGFEPTGSDVVDLDTIILKAKRCKAQRVLAEAPAARAVSTIFRRDTSSTNNVVKVFDNESVPQRQIEELQGDVTGCFAETILTLAQQSKTPAKYEASVSPVSVGDYGDATAAQRVTVVATPTTGDPTTLLFDYVLTQVGATTINLQVIAQDTATAAEVETTAMPKLVDRVKAAGG